MKTNHLYISLLSSQNVIFDNRSSATAINGNWEYLNARGVYVIFLKQGFFNSNTFFWSFLISKQKHTPAMWLKRLNKHLVSWSRPNLSQMDDVFVTELEASRIRVWNVSVCLSVAQARGQELHEMCGRRPPSELQLFRRRLTFENFVSCLSLRTETRLEKGASLSRKLKSRHFMFVFKVAFRANSRILWVHSCNVFLQVIHQLLETLYSFKVVHHHRASVSLYSVQTLMCDSMWLDTSEHIWEL